MALRKILSALTLLLVATPSLAASPYRVSLGFASWQDTLSVTSPAGANSPLESTAFAALPGVSYEFPFSGPYYVDIGGALVLGGNNAGFTPASAVNAGISYAPSSATLYGFLARAGIHWRATESPISVGVSVPLLIKRTSWPTPPGNYTLNNDSLFSLGALLETTVNRGDLAFTPRVGFVQSTANYFWEFELSYPL